jgi:hypothetical protein
MQDILQQLMIEQWNNETSYDDYFNVCKPKNCTATYVSRGNIVYIITTITSLIGGLKDIYIFLVPFIVKVIGSVIWPFIKRKFHRNRIATTTTTTPSHIQ